jgi:WD40 repeat protein
VDPTERETFDVRFSTDGMYYASGNSDNTASLYGMASGFPGGPIPQTTNTHIGDFVGHSQRVMSVDFSPDSKLLATSAGDGTARLWNTTNGVLLRTIEGGGGTGWPNPTDVGGVGVGRVRFSADGKTLLTSSNGTIRFWRVSDGKLLLTYTTAGNGVIAVSPDGKHFAYGTGVGAIGETNTIYLARMPLFVTGASVQPNGFQLEWQGGTGLYQVEQRTNGLSGPWEAIGVPITNLNLTVPLTNGSRFFRVRDAGSPP